MQETLCLKCSNLFVAEMMIGDTLYVESSCTKNQPFFVSSCKLNLELNPDGIGSIRYNDGNIGIYIPTILKCNMFKEMDCNE